MVARKNADAAFKLLSPLENTRAGDADFDYWLGVSAFESNRLERAVIAFERTLLTNPDFDSARLELGRTYLRMGSLDLAEQEFKRLEPRTTTPAGKQAITTYLDQVAKQKNKQKLAFNRYLEIGAGHDTNISSTTGDFTNAIRASFGLNGILPTGNSIKRGERFGAFNGGGDIVWRYREDRSLFASVGARLRGHRNAGEFNYGLLDAGISHEFRHDTNAWSLGAFAQLFRQDGAFTDSIANTRIINDRNSGGVTADWRREIADQTLLTVAAQGAAYRYRSNPTQDTDQATLSATVTASPQALVGGTLGISAFAGRDRAKRPLVPGTETDVSRRNLGVRLFAQSDPRLLVSGMLSLGWSQRRDDAAFARATIVEFGRDRLLDATARLTWRFADQWSLSPYVTVIRNQSNIALYNFNKTEGGLLLRFELN